MVVSIEYQPGTTVTYGSELISDSLLITLFYLNEDHDAIMGIIIGILDYPL